MTSVRASESELELAVSAAREAGALLTDAYRQNAGVQSLKGRDIKTEADLAAEACILRTLAPSRLPAVAEETAADQGPPDGRFWLVDPLDGTMNFSRGFPMYGVSIALWSGGEPQLGVVFDIARGLLFRGIVGLGAWCNERRIRVSNVSDRSQAVLATGFPTHRDYSPDALGRFVARVRDFKKIRMIGSASLSLAWVASGAFDAYTEEEIMLWDVAAGLALVLAAGGTIQVQSGRRHWSVTAAATNGALTV